MAALIRNGRIAAESWHLLDADGLRAWEAGESGEARVLIPAALWRSHFRTLEMLPAEFGVLLQATDDPGELAEDLERIPVIAIQFARFSDGRGYSIARQLRGRYGYRGELRAVGDVLRDQLFYMKRVGFDAFELRADQDTEAALRAFQDFSESYQAAVDQPLPLFRRRAA